MSLSLFPHKKCPSNCGECEFSFAIDPSLSPPLVCCSRNNTHHSALQGLCAWYVRLGLDELKIELASTVPSWQRAILIQALPGGGSTEAIRNIIEGVIDNKLAQVIGDDHEK